MKKTLILLFALITVGCSNSEVEKVTEVEKVNEIAHLPIKQSSFTTSQNESYDFLGEMGEFGLIKKTFKIDKEDTYTGIFWVDNQDKLNELVGKEIKLYGINEKTKEKELLATSTIEKLSNDGLEVPESDLSLKFNATLNFVRKGKWKVDAYVENNLLGTVVLYVEGKEGI